MALIASTLSGVLAADKGPLADLARLDQPLKRVATSPVVLSDSIKQAGRDDTVTLTAIIGPDGRVARIDDLKAATVETGKVATEAVKKWVFAQSFVDGQPVSVAVPVAIAIRLGQATDASVDTDADTGLPKVAEATFEFIPEYPESLKAAPVNGYAVVNVLVDAEGKAADPVVEFASHGEFAAPATRAIATWTFAPAVAGGTPVAMRTTVTVSFSAKSALWTAEERDMQSRLRYLRDYDEGPREKSSKSVVFPYDALVAGRQGGVMLNIIIAPDGKVARSVPEPGSDPDFVGAIRASLAWWEFFPATKAGEPVFGMVQMQFTFDPQREEFAFDATTHELVASLRAGTAQILGLKQVDQYPKPVNQVAPVFPADHEGSVAGEALVECIIDATGRPQLPRVIRASTPEFGWAAATAVAQWRFDPAIKGGNPVASRARLPIKIASDTPVAP